MQIPKFVLNVFVVLTLLMVVSLAGCLGEDDNAKGEVPGSTLVEEAQAQAEQAQPEVSEPDASGPNTAESDQAALPRSTETFVAQSAARRSSLTGFTRARSSMTLVAEEGGRVEQVLADVGDTLGSSGVFAKLDTTFIRLDLEANRANQQRLKSDVAYNRKEMDRYEALVASKNAPQSTLDANVRAHQTATQELKAMQVQERVLAERLRRFTIKGPVGWKVNTRYIEPGEWVTAGEPVAELGLYKVLLVPFALTSTEYRALKEMGGTVALTLTDFDETIQAKVLRVSPGFDPQTRKINVDLEIANGDFEFRGGLRTELNIDLPDPGGAVVVPQSALIKAYEEYFLMTPDNERVRVVLLGAADEGMRRVTSPDVRPGDSFLLHP